MVSETLDELIGETKCTCPGDWETCWTFLAMMPLWVHFRSKWYHTLFSAFWSIFHRSTPQCNEWRFVGVRSRKMKQVTKRCAVSACIRETESPGHSTLQFKN
jgi:hypothetical protein